MELIKTHTKTLTKVETEILFQKLNTGRQYYIDPNSYAMVGKIIEFWFETQGYDFWDNPYPEVSQWEVTKDEELIFTYTTK